MHGSLLKIVQASPLCMKKHLMWVQRPEVGWKARGLQPIPGNSQLGVISPPPLSLHKFWETFSKPIQTKQLLNCRPRADESARPTSEIKHQAAETTQSFWHSFTMANQVDSQCIGFKYPERWEDLHTCWLRRERVVNWIKLSTAFATLLPVIVGTSEYWWAYIYRYQAIALT